MFGGRPGGFTPNSNLGLDIGGRHIGPPPPFYSPNPQAPLPPPQPADPTDFVSPGV